MLTVILNKNEEKEKQNGFPWVFNNEINAFEGEIINGDICRVLSFDRSFVGYGFLNTSSKIMVRMLSLNEEECFDEEFYKRRILTAVEHRKNLGFWECCRLIFAEADFLPGLIVDKYGEYLSVQFLCLGIDKIKNMLIGILVEIINPKGIYERSDVSVRKKEGLEECKGILYGNFTPQVEVVENGIRFIVDIENGQKTGYFLDQKLNRDIMRLYSKDKAVLDCFSNVGGFALHACKYGAKYVDACDISQKACEDIVQNARINGFTQLNAVCTDVFDYLRNPKNHMKYDVIVLDPPAFTKDKATVKRAYRGYKEINLQALKIIKPGGYLLTFSCSQHMTPDLFMQMLKEAAEDSKRKIQFLDFRIQSPDHPALLTAKEQLYLKCMILRVL